jgi:hypothetical protein
MDRWKKAVINLECAGDSEHFLDRFKRIEQLKQDLDKGHITFEQYSKEIIPKARDIRYQGTAVFVIHHGRRYLLTARHVLWDKQSAKREYQEEEGRAQQWPEDMRLSLL